MWLPFSLVALADSLRHAAKYACAYSTISECDMMHPMCAASDWAVGSSVLSRHVLATA